MKYIEYNLTDKEGKSNCVIRSLCKLYTKEYDEVLKGLCDIQKELNANSFNDIEVFETYMKRLNTIPINYGKDIKIEDLKLDNGSYIVFCWNKKDFYHMVPIIDNTLYDKTNQSLELYTISLYKKN